MRWCWGEYKITYYSFDPRWDIRETIGYKTDYNNDNVDEYCINVNDDYGDTVSVPLFTPGETQAGEPYPMPFIEMVLISAPAQAHNFTGDVRQQEAYIDFNIWYCNTDNISSVSWGKKVSDSLVDSIMTYRHSVTSTHFVEVINDGREIIENPTGKQIIFHRIMEVHVIKYG